MIRAFLFFVVVLLVPSVALAQVGLSGRWESTQGEKRTHGPQPHF